MEGLWVGIVEPYFHHNFLGQLYMFLPVSLVSLTESFFFCLPLQKLEQKVVLYGLNYWCYKKGAQVNLHVKLWAIQELVRNYV